MTQSYDTAGRVYDIKGTKGATTLTDAYYKYSGANGTLCASTGSDGDLRQSVKDQDGNTTTYCYDQLDRVTRAQTKSSSGTTTQDISYGYDAVGNILYRQDSGGTKSYGYNEDNELCWQANGSYNNACGTIPSGATTFSYDGQGQETGNSAGLSINWNPRGQMSSITPAGGTATAFSYLDGGQEQIAGQDSTVWQNNVLGIDRKRLSDGTSTYYIRDNKGQLIGERLPSGATDYYLFDGLGSVTALTDSTGAAANRYSYDPYGQTATTGTTENPFTYTGAFTGPDGLIHDGARWYEPASQRWTQQDPVDHPEDQAQDDLYGYAGDDPVNVTDPTGLGWSDRRWRRVFLRELAACVGPSVDYDCAHSCFDALVHPHHVWSVFKCRACAGAAWKKCSEHAAGIANRLYCL